MFKFIKRIKARVMYYKAVEMAESRHAAERLQYYVISTENNQLVVANRKEFRQLKRKHYAPQMTTKLLKSVCVYHTANACGEDTMSEEQRLTQRLLWEKSCIIGR